MNVNRFPNYEIDSKIQKRKNKYDGTPKESFEKVVEPERESLETRDAFGLALNNNDQDHDEDTSNTEICMYLLLYLFPSDLTKISSF